MLCVDGNQKKTKSRYIPKLSAKEYEQLRIKRVETISKCLKGKPKSEEHKKHLSEALKGQTRELTKEQSTKCVQNYIRG